VSVLIKESLFLVKESLGWDYSLKLVLSLHSFSGRVGVFVFYYYM
jgi:hypothetical protein